MKPYLIREVVTAIDYTSYCKYVCMYVCMYDIINDIVYVYTVLHCMVHVHVDSTTALASHRMVIHMSTLPVSKATLMWCTNSSGQEPVST